MQDALICHPISLKTFQSKTGYHTIIACKLITNTVFEKFVYRGFKVIFHIRQKLIVIDITLRYTCNNGVSVVQPAFACGKLLLTNDFSIADKASVFHRRVEIVPLSQHEFVILVWLIMLTIHALVVRMAQVVVYKV